MELVLEKEIFGGCNKGSQLTVIKLLFNAKATKHRYVIIREERSLGYCGSIDYNEGSFRKKKNAIKAFEMFCN